jgi:hypothetical protein
MKDERWPALPYDAWQDTYHTLHMWSQMAGKVALAQGPALNHCWGVALHLTARGLATGLLSHDSRRFSIEFDLVDHRLIVQLSDGNARLLPLAPKTVAQFYREFVSALDELGLHTKIWSKPSELPEADTIRFEDDTVHHSYDPVYANRFWRILEQIERVFVESRCRFLGKTSPVNFFWGSFDLALTRFSGRPAPAPPKEWPRFMREAYSHEVISHGFWPGSGAVLEPAFYAYAVPEPAGFREATVRPAAAFYHTELKEFILPYEAVRTSASPEAAITEFVETTYASGATLGGWDRAQLEK